MKKPALPIGLGIMVALLLSCGEKAPPWQLPLAVVGDRAFVGVTLKVRIDIAIEVAPVLKTFGGASFDDVHRYRANVEVRNDFHNAFILYLTAEDGGCKVGAGSWSTTVDDAKLEVKIAPHQIVVNHVEGCGTTTPDGGPGGSSGTGGVSGSGGTTQTGGQTGDDGGTGGVTSTGGAGTGSGGTSSGGTPGSGGASTGGAGGMGTGGANTGGAGSGGIPGTGGVPGAIHWCEGAKVIDDFEAGTGHICNNSEKLRDGYWFTYRDTGSTLSPAGSPTPSSVITPPRTPTSMRGMHITGTYVMYAGVGCFLNPTPATYNASAYTGLQFYAKGTASAPRMIVQTSATESTTYGGQCTLPTLSCAGNETPITGLLPDTWTQVTVPFSTLTGGTSPFNSADLWSIEFQPGPGVFDFWIDDLSFF